MRDRDIVPTSLSLLVLQVQLPPGVPSMRELGCSPVLMQGSMQPLDPLAHNLPTHHGLVPEALGCSPVLMQGSMQALPHGSAGHDGPGRELLVIGHGLVGPTADWPPSVTAGNVAKVRMEDHARSPGEVFAAPCRK